MSTSTSAADTHSSGTSPSPHQAVTWSLSSPFYNDVIHLTGVYIFPNESKLEEFFHTLTAHSNHPLHEPHIYAGDFNAWTAEEIEGHITPLDSHALFHRMGDTNPAHLPASPLTNATSSYGKVRRVGQKCGDKSAGRGNVSGQKCRVGPKCRGYSVG